MLLDVEKLSVIYPDGFVAIREASVQLPEGQVFALLGASGSGKSSLLRGIAGLEATTGSIRIRGQEVSAIPAWQRDCGMVFQESLLFPNRDVAGNIAYGIERRGVDTRARVTELLDLVELPGFGGRAVSTLSGGQAQRVALARALARQPALMLLDEPLSSLDRSLRKTLAHQLRRILTGTGTAALYVTHDHDEAAIVADRILHVQAGQLLPTH